MEIVVIIEIIVEIFIIEIVVEVIIIDNTPPEGRRSYSTTILTIDRPAHKAKPV